MKRSLTFPIYQESMWKITTLIIISKIFLKKLRIFYINDRAANELINTQKINSGSQNNRVWYIDSMKEKTVVQ